MDSNLQAKYDLYVKLDKNPVTSKEIQSLASTGDLSLVAELLERRLEFGTAGLRGRMQGGFNRMNELVVIQASVGLRNHLSTLPSSSPASPRQIIIAHDHRHQSLRFAILIAAVFLSSSEPWQVLWLEGNSGTPLTPFGIEYFNGVVRTDGGDVMVGVMVTASHNPKDDNGYKVYAQTGTQIIPPLSTHIADAIHDIAEDEIATEIWESTMESIAKHENFKDVTEEVTENYFKHLLTLRSNELATNITSLITITHTALHGVSTPYVLKALFNAGFKNVTCVPEQKECDADFPTVRFPNPEEKGALDLAVSTAPKIHGSIILANDPDMDRFTAAEYLTATGDWKLFTGDQLGSLFGWWVYHLHSTSFPTQKLAFVASTVSSKFLKALAAHHSTASSPVRFEECLTGFKYIGSTAKTLEKDGWLVGFGYEEAIGYMLSPLVRDKDGISAAVAFGEMATYLYGRGMTVSTKLEELYSTYGRFVTKNGYWVCRNPSLTAKIFKRLRSSYSTNAKITLPSAHPLASQTLSYPISLAGLPVKSIRDLTVGYDSSTSDLLPTLPESDGEMITFTTEGVTVTLRGSGTEPKIKFYIEASGSSTLEEIEALLKKVLDDIEDNWIQCQSNGLAKATV